MTIQKIREKIKFRSNIFHKAIPREKINILNNDLIALDIQYRDRRDLIERKIKYWNSKIYNGR